LQPFTRASRKLTYVGLELAVVKLVMPARHNIDALRKCYILYAEDDDATAYLFQLALAESGLTPQVIRVTNGEEAIAFLHKKGFYHEAPTPDLLLLDLNLPRKNGFEVLAEIRNSALPCRDIEVVIFSSSSSPMDQRRALALGASKYVVKSLDLDEFVESVREICDLIPRGDVLKTA
jgi:chemotaxis family two-component system response regulator Rcp1